MEASIQDKALLKEAKAMGFSPKIDPDTLPDSSEEAEIFLEQNMKTNAEIAAQLGTALTLDWNDFDQKVFRRAVEDLVVCGMGVVKRENDPNYGITTKYIDPAYFLHSQTDDPNMSDIVYAGHLKRISIQELKRQAGEQISEQQYEQIAQTVMHKSYNDKSQFHQKSYDSTCGRFSYGYDDYLIDVMDFEFLSVDCVYYEQKESQFGNTGFTSRAPSTRFSELCLRPRAIQDGEPNRVRWMLHLRHGHPVQLRDAEEHPQERSRPDQG